MSCSGYSADVKSHAAQIGGAVLVGLQVAGHQFGQGYAQGAGQILQQADVRQALASFP